MALALCLLSGCVPLSFDLQSTDANVALPTAFESAPPAPAADAASSRVESVTLYCVSADMQGLTPLPRALVVSEDELLAERVMRALLAEPGGGQWRAIAPEGTRLLGIEYSGELVTVNLSVEALGTENEQQALNMRAAIVATLTGLDGVSCVSLLIGGREEGLLSLPVGAMRGFSESLPAQLAQLVAEEELAFGAAGDEAPRPLEREVVLYFAGRGGKYLLSEVHALRFTREEDYLRILIEALAAGPDDPCARSPLPEGALPLIETLEIVEVAGGRKAAHIAFSASFLTEMDRQGLYPWQLYAALTDTVVGFVPGVEALVLHIGDGLVIRTDRDGEEILFEDGLMFRDDFSEAVGRLTAVYYGSADGRLARTTRLTDQLLAQSPRALLALVFDGPEAWQAGALPVAPEGVTGADILGVAVREGTALVNLSANFYARCQGLDAPAERNLIYAMVDTLCELPGVSAARFYVEGEPLDSLAGSIYLRGPLYANPGLAEAGGA